MAVTKVPILDESNRLYDDVMPLGWGGDDPFIYHGTNANMSRGGSAGTKVWVGSVYPNYKLPGDTWLVATEQAVEPPITWFSNYSAATIAAADLSTLSTWADTGTAARDLAQPTSGKRPTLHVAGSGTPAYVRFGGAHAMQTAAFAAPLAQPATAFTAVRMTSVTTSASVVKRIYDGLDATNEWELQQRGNGTVALFQSYAGSSVNSGVAAPAVAGAWNVITEVRNGGSSKIRVNGVEVTSAAGSLSLGGLTVGSKFDMATVFGDFDLGDSRVTAGLLSPGQIAAQEAFLASRYGVTLAP
ncbi:LamG domain-containing protein [Herbiconiux daphne]|uniref:LamG domain-containing protein n=1 Tax=Herbiconiux daphne TaxID=2970914 RepID=A0ABT2GWP6_9MICO|nr:LamG domain-containing protein [Herbiconiux daphne]MCS5732383.1 LamG domain-containing protein [Herbiconiux daphne]